MALVGGFTMVLNYQVLVNKAERATKIDPDKAQMCFQLRKSKRHEECYRG